MTKDEQVIMDGVNPEKIIMERIDDFYQFFDGDQKAPFATFDMNTRQFTYLAGNVRENPDLAEKVYQKLLILSKHRTF